MKVTLVNPPQTASKYKFMGVIAPPLGIGYIAAVLRDNGIDVNILDASAEDMDFKEFSEEIKNRSPDIISISALTPTINKALETAKTAKEVLPNSIIVMGGYHPTFDFEETLKNDFVDIVIRGEGEYVLRDLVETIENEFNSFGSEYKSGFDYDDFIEMTDIEEIALAFAKCYERCGSGSYDVRQSNALIAFEFFTS